MGLKALKEAIQVAKDVDLEELLSVCELLPAKENKIKINIDQKFGLPHNRHIHKQWQLLQTKKSMEYKEATNLWGTTDHLRGMSLFSPETEEHSFNFQKKL